MDFINREKQRLSLIKKNDMKIEESGVWRLKKRPHILPDEYKNRVFLDGLTLPEIQFHKCYHHLNSSQSLCINFFQKFRQSNDGEKYLKELIGRIIGIDTKNLSIESEFEYKPEKDSDGTYFDFFVRLSNGIRVFFEIKYTESTFGGLSKKPSGYDSYDEKYSKVHKSILSKSLDMQNMNPDDFYGKNRESGNVYQIHRNIMHIQSTSDYVVFLYPFENEKLHKHIKNYLESGSVKKRTERDSGFDDLSGQKTQGLEDAPSYPVKKYKNVFLRDWRDVWKEAADICKNDNDYKDYYDSFAKRYPFVRD